MTPMRVPADGHAAPDVCGVDDLDVDAAAAWASPTPSVPAAESPTIRILRGLPAWWIGMILGRGGAALSAPAETARISRAPTRPKAHATRSTGWLSRRGRVAVTAPGHLGWAPCPALGSSGCPASGARRRAAQSGFDGVAADRRRDRLFEHLGCGPRAPRRDDADPERRGRCHRETRIEAHDAGDPRPLDGVAGHRRRGSGMARSIVKVRSAGAWNQEVAGSRAVPEKWSHG